MFNPFKIFSKKREVDIVCFDLDNTLYDNYTAEAEAEAYIAKDFEKLFYNKKSVRAVNIIRVFNDVKNSHLYHDLDPEKNARSLWFRETFERLHKNLSIAESLRYEKKYWDFLVSKIILFTNTINTLEQLKNLGYRLAAISDSDGNKDIKINRVKIIGLYGYFDYFITTDDTKKNKPAIENFEYLKKISGIEPINCVMVGDHPELDLLNAKKLGYLTIWSKEKISSSSHYNYVDYEISDINQILPILEKIRN